MCEFQLKIPSPAGIVKKLQDLAINKKGYMDLQDVGFEESGTFFYGATLQKKPTLTLPCSWSTADPSTFLIRGNNYLKDQQKVIHCNVFVFFLIFKCRSTHMINDVGTSQMIGEGKRHIDANDWSGLDKFG